jgi:hypothetical protein
VAPLGLDETQIRDRNIDNVSRLLLRNWSFLYNYDFSCRGRVWVCWNADVVKVDALACQTELFMFVSLY